MDYVINIGLMKHPLNWAIILIFLLFGMIIAEIVRQVWASSPKSA